MPPESKTGIDEKPSWSEISGRIDRLWDAGENDAALRLCLQKGKQFKKSAALLAKLAAAYSRTGQLRLAERALSAARENGLPEGRYIARRAGLLWQGGDMARFAECAEQLRRLPDRETPALLRQLARAYLALGAWDKAEQTAEALIDRAPSQAAVQMKLEAFFERTDPSGWDAAFDDQLFRSAEADTFLEGIQLMYRYVSGRSDGMLSLLRRARDTWPDDPGVIALCREAGIAAAPGGAPPAPPATRHETPEAQLANARRVVLEKNQAAPPELLHRLVKAIENQISPRDLQRPLVEVDPERDVLISPRAPGDRLAVVFTGLMDRTALPLETLDAYLSAAGITAVYLRDFNRLLFCNGVQSMGGDFSSGVAGLRRVIDRIGGIGHVTTIGNSAGGTGALNFGLALPADRVLCFSTPTTIGQPFLDDINDRRGRLVLARLNKLVPQHLLDPRARLEAQSDPVRVDLVYGQNHPLDRPHAERLRGLPGVRLYGLGGSDRHASLTDVILRGAFLDMLAGNTAALGQLPEPGGAS